MAEKKNSEVPEMGESEIKKRARLDTKTGRLPVAKVPKPVNLEEFVIEKDQILNRRYTVVDKLGQGTYGEVWRCWDDDTKTHVAVKVCGGLYKNAASTEIRILKRLAEVKTERPRFVEILGSFKHGDYICIVLEKLGHNLSTVLTKNGLSPFPIDQVREFGAQILESVACMHEMRLIHTDLKPDNVLLVSSETRRYSEEPTDWRVLPESCDIKLIDFGTTFPGHKTYTSVVTATSYRAPEIVLGLGWTYPCDIWSVGCILVELSTGYIVFQAENDLEHLAIMEKVLGPLPEQMVKLVPYDYFSQGRVKLQTDSPERNAEIESLPSLEELVSEHVESPRSSSFVDLLKGLLNYDPDERLTARAALDHPFFKNPT